MKKVYFAGPLFCAGEKAFNLDITNILEQAGYSVFLPQRDGFEAFSLKDKTEEEIVKLIFDKDVKEILSADIFFMVLDGRVPDDGACVELGIAYANGKRCYGIKTDVRAMELGLDLNPLIAGCFKTIIKESDVKELKEKLKEYLAKNSLWF